MDESVGSSRVRGRRVKGKKERKGKHKSQRGGGYTFLILHFSASRAANIRGFTFHHSVSIA